MPRWSTSRRRPSSRWRRRSRRLGHETLRLGNPHAVLRAAGQGTLPRLDAVLTIAEGYGPRSREAWVPAPLRDGGDPDARLRCPDPVDDPRQAVGASHGRRGRRAGPAHASLASPEEAAAAPLPAPFPLFVKPRWEGTAKGIGPSSRVESREALVAEVARVVGTYRQPALVEAFLDGPEYTVTLVGHRPPRALPTLQRALEASTRIGAHALLRHPRAAGRLAPRDAGRARWGARGRAHVAGAPGVRRARVPGLRPGRLPPGRRRPSLTSSR